MWVGAYDDARPVTAKLDRLGIDLVPDDREVAMAAGRVYRAYRVAGGTRRWILPDFLIWSSRSVTDAMSTADRRRCRRGIVDACWRILDSTPLS